MRGLIPPIAGKLYVTHNLGGKVLVRGWGFGNAGGRIASWSERTNLRDLISMTPPRTLFEKVWEAHLVSQPTGWLPPLYIDLHLIHEVTSPQAFDGLRVAGRKVRQPLRTVATVDHNIPTEPRGTPITDPIAAKQIEALQKNCKEFGVPFFDMDSADQGIVHVIGPELGLTQPGMTIVCGDSHTSTHGAFGALAFGIGTSEVEHVLATQCLPQKKPKTMQVNVRGPLSEGVTAKDLALGIIGQIGTDGATGHVIEYTGEAVRDLSMEGRMTLCNMSIEAGARAGMIAPDETTFAYVKNRRFAPHGKNWDGAVANWRALTSDEGATYDTVIGDRCSKLAPFVTGDLNPGMVVAVTDRDYQSSATFHRTRIVALPSRLCDTWALSLEHPSKEFRVNRVFIGSCTNSPAGRSAGCGEGGKGISRESEDRPLSQRTRRAQGCCRSRHGPGQGTDRVRILRIAAPGRRRPATVPAPLPGGACGAKYPQLCEEEMAVFTRELGTYASGSPPSPGATPSTRPSFRSADRRDQSAARAATSARERGADDDADRQVDDVAAQDEVSEALDHVSSPISRPAVCGADHRSCGDVAASYPWGMPAVKRGCALGPGGGQDPLGCVRGK